MIAAGERFALSPVSATRYGRGYLAVRLPNASTGTITGRNLTTARAQEIADSQCTIIETAVLTPVNAFEWTVEFKVSHRIVPMEWLEDPEPRD